MKVLVLNAGSSSQKTRLYELHETLPELPPKPLWEANADWSEQPGATRLKITTASGKESEEELPFDERKAVIEQILEALWKGPTRAIASLEELTIVGHRVVHGGPDYHEPTRVTTQTMAAIKDLSKLAPAHNPANLEGIEAIARLLPQLPQVVVFDTAFHSQMPPEATIYPGPYAWSEKQLRRYGFHGISHQYCSRRAAQILKRDPAELRLITCHLGNGCSLAAIQGGRSIDTTMGFTPLEGLMMGTRSGSIDPGLLLYLLRYQGYTPERLDQTLNKESGLKGISGQTGDMRTILQLRARGDARASLAFNIYIHRLRANIGAMLAALGGLDALVFAGGVGENAAEVRAEVCQGLAFLGVQLDESLNARSPADQDISTASSKVRTLIVQTQEDWVIAQECWRLAQAG